MPSVGFQGAAAIPLLVVQSGSQASLAAGAESFVQINLPANLVLPAKPNTALSLPVLFQVNATDTANADLVATGNLNASPGAPVVQARVRNVGTVASGTWELTAMILGVGQAIGL